MNDLTSIMAAMNDGTCPMYSNVVVSWDDMVSIQEDLYSRFGPMVNPFMGELQNNVCTQWRKETFEQVPVGTQLTAPLMGCTFSSTKESK